VPQHWKEFAALGLSAALTTLGQGKAYTLTLSSYVEAVKQIGSFYAMANRRAGVRRGAPGKESALGAFVMLLGWCCWRWRRSAGTAPPRSPVAAVRPRDLGLDAAANVEIADLEPPRPRRRHDVVEDAVGHRSWKAPSCGTTTGRA